VPYVSIRHLRYSIQTREYNIPVRHFTGALKDHSVQISMDGKGRYMDNTFIERLWRSVKYEKIFLEEFETVLELLSGLKEYFEFYNFERPHQSLAGKTPAEIYYGREVAKKAA
jgi:putative transposase